MNGTKFKNAFYGRVELDAGGNPRIVMSRPEAWASWKKRMAGQPVEVYIDRFRMSERTVAPKEYLLFVLVPILAEVLGYESNYAALQAVLGLFCDVSEGVPEAVRKMKMVQPVEQIKDAAVLADSVRTWMQTPGEISESGVIVPAMDEIALDGAGVTYDGDGFPLIEYHLGTKEGHVRLDRYRMKPAHSFVGFITDEENPRFVAEKKARFNAHAKQFAGKEIIVAAWRHFPTRTNLQNAYYWAVCVPVIDWAAEIYNRALTHELLKWKFLRIEARASGSGFVRPAYTMSTADLDTKKFARFVDDAAMWAQEPGVISPAGITIPKPNQHFVPSGLAYLDGGEVRIVGMLEDNFAGEKFVDVVKELW